MPTKTVATYAPPAAARMRVSGGVGGKRVDRQAPEEYLAEVDIPQAIAGVRAGSATCLLPAFSSG